MKKKAEIREKLYSLVKEKLSDSVSEEDFYNLFDLLDKSVRLNLPYQVDFIRTRLEAMEYDKAVRISNAWYDVLSIVKSVSWYNDMHIANGGIVAAGDNGFYMDFPSWLLSRGSHFLKSYFTEGAKFVINYIEEKEIPRSEYLYEGISYEFLDYAF